MWMEAEENKYFLFANYERQTYYFPPWLFFSLFKMLHIFKSLKFWHNHDYNQRIWSEGINLETNLFIKSKTSKDYKSFRWIKGKKSYWAKNNARITHADNSLKGFRLRNLCPWELILRNMAKYKEKVINSEMLLQFHIAGQCFWLVLFFYSINTFYPP